MVIESGNNGSINTNSSFTARAKAPARPETSETTAPENTQQAPDNVSLSSRGQSINRLESEISNADEVNFERVNELRNEINAGNYAVDAEALASRIIDQDALF